MKLADYFCYNRAHASRMTERMTNRPMTQPLPWRR